MKLNWKYFILVFLLAGCKENSNKDIEENSPLYQEPFSVSLNTSGGYTLNLLSGDSIKPLINSLGQTIKTGIAVPFIIKKINSEEVIKSKIIEGVQRVQTLIPDNVYPIPDKLPVIHIDTTRLKKIKLGEGDQSFVLRNTYGVLPTGIPIPVTGKKISLKEPHPVKAVPMRYKDNTTTSIQYLDVDQGLGFSYVYAVYEDRKGNLWFGMDGTGISKYDGINITTYSVKEGLSNNVILSILEDRKNNLWFATQGGVTCFDGKNFTQYTEKEGLSNNDVLSVYEDKNENLWISTKGGLTKYDGEYFTHYTRKEGLPSDTVYSCIEDSKGNIWIGTYLGAAKFDGKSFTLFTQEDGLSGKPVSNILEDKKGNIWMGITGGGINKFDGKTFTHYTNKQGLSNNIVWSMIKDRKDNLWIGTSGGGLNKFDGKKFIHYKLEQGLSNIKIRGITEDKNGNIWIGTDGGGVNKLNATSFDYKVPEAVMDNNRIRPILKDKNGNLWFGTEGGNVGKLETKEKTGEGRLFTYYKVQDKLLQKGQRSLLQDQKGNIWIGTTGSGIVKYDGANFFNYSLGTDMERQSVYAILEDKKGNIWFGQRDGSILRYDGKDFDFYTTSEGLPGSIIYSMLEDRKGNIWFCTQGGGIYKYDGSGLINFTEKEGLFSKEITSITEDDNGNIWLGTLGAGVCKFDGENFIYYSEQQGLSNNNVWSVFCDSAKQLWFGTDKGLTLFIPQNDNAKSLKDHYAVYNFGSQDGLKAIDFNLHSVCVDNDNHIMWGTGKSVPSFNLNKVFQTDSIRSLHLNYIEINDRFYDFRNLPDSAAKKITYTDVIPFSNCPDKLILTSDLNHLSFHFSAIDWSAPDKIKYSYRMIGQDEKWSKPSGEAMTDYRNLSHGNYQFEVRAIGQSQVWTAPYIYSFTILPAWWETRWFRALLIAATLVLLFYIVRFIYYYQLRKQRIALEKQLAVQYERQRISTEMHDDIGAGLSGIRLLTEVTKTKVKDEQGAEGIEKIYQSIGDISAKMKEVIWSLNTENDNLSNLISYTQKQVRAWLENYHCILSIEIPDTIPAVEINGETRRNILLMVKEAIHNIIKHSGADKVDIRMNYNNKKFIIIISDNGVGMNEKQNNSPGNGMKNMQHRVRKLNGKFFITHKEGLTLTFEIPLQPSA